MTFDPVPWFTGGGAQHSPEVARLLAYAATNGSEGIVSPGDLKVVPLAVPGSSVRVLTGAFLALNRAAGGSQQTYVGRNPTEDVVDVSATGSSGGRSDLIVARIEDPFMPGEPWADPSDVTVGPYVFPRVIPNVAAGTTTMPSGQSGIPLARIDLPSSTATVTSGMITDLRRLAQPRWTSRLFGGPPDIPYDITYVVTYKEPGDPYNMGPVEGVQPLIEIPSWATHMDVVAQSTLIAGTNPWNSGATLVKVGPMYGPHINWDFGSTDGLVQLTATSTAQEVPSSIRGTTQQASLRIRIDNGALTVTKWSTITFQVAFYERAV